MEINNSNMELAFVGTSNWDIWVEPKGVLWAVPKPDKSGCKTSYFGDKHHIKRLMQQGYFDYQPTEAGLELLVGLQNRLIQPDNGKHFALLCF